MRYFDKATIERVRRGYYSAVYFNRAKEILLKEKNLKEATMQIFQKKEGSILCGVMEVMELLKVGTGYFDPPSSRLNRDYGEARWIDKSGELEVRSLVDGDRLNSWETVMHISGPYAYFAHLESLYLGILARRTMVATNTKKCVEAADGVPVIFFGDRFDYFLNQEGDGYAAKIGGAQAVCTEAMSKGFGEVPVGTIPHSLIALTGGDTVKAADLFHKYYPNVNLIALVDFENDSLKTSLEVARKMGKKLWGVRLDTAGEVTDKSIKYKKEDLNGVNPYLVRAVREALDKEGFSHVKIVVSGGFYTEKIKKFTKEKVPVDAYGVGSAIIVGENDFTADIVDVEGKSMAKVGRNYKANSRLQRRSL
ncbi:hypothetical protein A2W14_03490 [Candidatus Gottesmanbacteria bacterium RBG_16_37_8]|uniref:nicotinate phosphoribosyltransferase n=1 Tax=Candidatus Gottesmanbacteria bacterium RBG_16_37_8 TaxID=1798371 RepID=A0A1F5YSE8_9BACT|nr:MAG: hypothetical protein A2W14_03490 [Candidatus Gottesmanbacteria bacterium RBG_16_37_8]